MVCAVERDALADPQIVAAVGAVHCARGVDVVEQRDGIAVGRRVESLLQRVELRLADLRRIGMLGHAVGTVAVLLQLEAVRQIGGRELDAEGAAGDGERAAGRSVNGDSTGEDAVRDVQGAAVFNKEGLVRALDGRARALDRDGVVVRLDADAGHVDVHVADDDAARAPRHDADAGIAEAGAHAADRDAADRTAAAADLDALLEVIKALALVVGVAVDRPSGDREAAAEDDDGLPVKLVDADVVQRQIAAEAG